MRHVVLDGVDEVDITVAFDWLLEDSHSRWARFRGLRTLPDDESLWSISVPTQANYESAIQQPIFRERSSNALSIHVMYVLHKKFGKV